MKTTVTWSPGDTWRKVGYLTYQNSLDYRYVLEQNPEWNMTITPPVGTVIQLQTGGASPGKLNMTSPFWDQPTEVQVQDYFPFSDQAEYEAQIVKYSFYALVNNDQLNGYTADSEKAIRGLPQVSIR